MKLALEPILEESSFDLNASSVEMESPITLRPELRLSEKAKSESDLKDKKAVKPMLSAFLRSKIGENFRQKINLFKDKKDENVEVSDDEEEEFTTFKDFDK